MRSAFPRWIVVGAGVLAAWSAGALPSTAQSKDEQLFVGGMDLKTVLFGSLDAGRSTFLTVGAKQTFTGPLDRSGLVSLVTVGYGGSPGQAGSEKDSDTVVRPTIQAGALIGYQWAFDRVFVAGFIGPEFDARQPASLEEASRLSQRRLGLRVQGELWAHPTQDIMLAATVVAGSARSSLWGRAAFGYRVWNDIFVGPEVALSRSENFREWRVGAHVTGVQLGQFTFGLSGGWRGEENDPHGGAHVNLSGYIRL